MTRSVVALVLVFLGAVSGLGQAPLCNAPCPAPGLTGSPAPGADPRIEELKKIDSELDAAKLRGDKAALTAALADEMIAVDSSGEITAKAEVLERVSAAPAAMKMSISGAETQVKLFGDTAIVSSKKTRKWSMNGVSNSKDFRETNTYVGRDGRWLQIASQRSEEPPPYVAKDVAFEIPFDERQAFGDKKAPVVIVEFSDYQCPFCRQFAAETLSRIEKEYIRTGQAVLIFRDYPLEIHPRAFAAATAAQCAGASGKFREMNERLLRDPVELSQEHLVRDARELGIDASEFQRCVDDPATGERIHAGMKEAEGYGVKGTPIFVIGVRKPDKAIVQALRMIQGAYPYDVFKTTLDSVIRARTP